MASMHAEGFLHRDAYARNVLVRVDEDDVRVWFLDCRAGGTGLFGKGPLQDLATLDMDLVGRVPATDRLRGLRAWLAEGEPSWHVHRKVARLRERLRRSEERRGRRR
jgi:tRNA A-37 threonylcarbamoyl transferase component Bud32